MNAQDALWYLPNAMGHGWWYMVSGISTFAAMTIFVYMIMNERFSGLLIARCLLAGSMVCFALVPLNSGWMPWGALLSSIGCLYTGFLIATNWCERNWEEKRRAIMSLFPAVRHRARREKSNHLD